jgi:hypothetical protein
LCSITEVLAEVEGGTVQHYQRNLHSTAHRSTAQVAASSVQHYRRGTHSTGEA